MTDCYLSGMRSLKEAGVRVNFFFARNPEHLKELVDAGVDFPLVDDLGRFLEAAQRLDLPRHDPVLKSKNP